MKSKTILFFSQYPDSSNIQDGMMQRIQTIDEKYALLDKVYLAVSWKQNFIPTYRKIENRKVFSLNLFLHFYIVLYYILLNRNIYIHSLHNFLWVWPLFVVIPKGFKNIILDLHGVVPEELYFIGKSFQAKYASYIESFLFKKVNYAICVTESMKEYYIKKYSKVNIQYCVLPIIPNNLINIKSRTVVNDKINLIYVGNTQKWQNVDKVVKTIKRLENCEDYSFTILTKELFEVQVLLKKYNVAENRVELLTVEPEQLERYYKKATYGFIIRDDTVLNSVANPTKLIEYMAYGIIPIVDYVKIGDMYKLGYEYKSIEELNCNLTNFLSEKNIKIYKTLLSKELDLSSLLINGKS